MAEESGGIDQERGFRPLISEKVASSGDYIKSLETSPFYKSSILRTAAPFIESGQFAQGVDVTLEALENRGIKLEFEDYGKYSPGTRRDTNGQEIMLLKKDFNEEHPSKALYELLHRNMSLILQRSGLREDQVHLKKLLDMDIAYVESARLGATRLQDPVEKAKVSKIATDIEMVTNMKMTSLEEPPALQPARGKT